jgi:hypothetical protein
MRTDITSMNPGKAIAQGSHAANVAAKQLEKKYPDAYKAWAGEYDFGTTIVLDGGSMSSIETTIDEIQTYAYTGHKNFVADVIEDPTYPLRDGNVTHLFPLNTCAYEMCERGSKIANCLSIYSLHR